MRLLVIGHPTQAILEIQKDTGIDVLISSKASYVTWCMEHNVEAIVTRTGRFFDHFPDMLVADVTSRRDEQIIRAARTRGIPVRRM